MSALSLSGRRFAPVAAIAVSVLLVGCANTTSQQSWSGAFASADHRAVTPTTRPATFTRAKRPHVPQMEADGLPAQTAPLRRRHQTNDDPSEPYSPYYGTVPFKPSKPTRDQDLDQPDLRSARSLANEDARILSSRRLSPVEAELIMSRAIAQHERRYP